MSSVEFDVAQFGGLTLKPKSTSRNFPLLVEGYDLSGPVAFVYGTDLFAGNGSDRIRVFLRDMVDRSSSTIRIGIDAYGTDPTTCDPNSPLYNQASRCYTPPGGVLMIQASFPDLVTGGISAYWINRLSTDNTDGKINVLPSVIARLSRPKIRQVNDAGKPLCMCDLIHTHKAKSAESVQKLDQVLLEVLSTSQTPYPGKNVAVIRLVATASGKHSTLTLDRLSKRIHEGVYEPEQPISAIDRLWSSMDASYKAGLQNALNTGSVHAIVIPGTRYRLVGKSLDLISLNENQRPGLPWERFLLHDQSNDSGFLYATVILQRHKQTDEKISTGDDYFVTGAWPEQLSDVAMDLRTMVFEAL